MTQDQLLGLLRQVLPIFGTLLTVFGISEATATATINLIMEVLGPLVLVGSAVWAYIANSRKSIMTSASQPVTTGAPAPKIVLPAQESKLASELPANVTSAPHV